MVEYDESGVVEIHLDGEGADPLLERIHGLLATHGAPEHDRLATPSGAELVNMVNLPFWPDKDRDRRGETR